MGITDRLKPFGRAAKIVVAVGSGASMVSYAVMSTKRTIAHVVSASVLDRDKRFPEYIYIDDPVDRHEIEKEPQGLRQLRTSLMWRLLWVCRHGDNYHRDMALKQLANVDKSKDWEYLKLAQAMDAKTAVLLARTEGADVRFFLPPPVHIRRLAGSPDYRYDRLRKMLAMLNQHTTPHSCTSAFLSKYFLSVKEWTSDDSESKPDTPDERRLCVMSLDAAHHHLSLSDLHEAAGPAHEAVLEMVSELLMLYGSDGEVRLAAARLLTELSGRPALLETFHRSGLLSYLATWLRGEDVRMSLSAAVCLANLAGEGQYRRGLYLLHPIYRTTDRPYCDVVFVHGLRGGVFVTWRQRDNKNSPPVGLLGKAQGRAAGAGMGAREERSHGETVLTSTEVKEEPCRPAPVSASFAQDPDMRQMLSELEDMEEDALLSDLELVLEDLPLTEHREQSAELLTQRHGKREALQEELEDKSSFTTCWPKDWLPRDCAGLRILGLDYSTKVTEWSGDCGADGSLEERAASLRELLGLAGAGGAPLVLVAHSLGGLVAERALLDCIASDEPAQRRLADRTRALVYYSTPHRGSSLANLRRATAALLWPSTIVRQLQEDSPTLLQLQRDFSAAAERRGWETVCFGEAKPTVVSPFKVSIQLVSEESADLGRGVFYLVPLDHVTICKPATRQSLLYRSVLDIVKRTVREEKERRRSRNVSEVNSQQ